MPTLLDLVRQRLAEKQAGRQQAEKRSVQGLQVIHEALESVAQRLRHVSVPISIKAAELKAHREFGGDIRRYAVFYLIKRHRRNSTFAPLTQRFLSDYRDARALNGTLTREQFISTYTDQVLDFLNDYQLSEHATANSARIEYLTIRMLVAVVAHCREQYGERFEAACRLERQARDRFYRSQENAALGGFLK